MYKKWWWLWLTLLFQKKGNSFWSRSRVCVSCCCCRRCEWSTEENVCTNKQLFYERTVVKNSNRDILFWCWCYDGVVQRIGWKWWSEVRVKELKGLLPTCVIHHHHYQLHYYNFVRRNQNDDDVMIKNVLLAGCCVGLSSFLCCYFSLNSPTTLLA